MDQPDFSGGDQSGTDPARELHELVVSEATAAEAIGERPAAHASHHHVGAARLPPVVDDRHDGLVSERRHPLRVRFEIPDEVGVVGHLGPDDPDHDLPFDPGEVRDGHGSVVSPAQPLAQPVATQRGADRLVQEQPRVLGEDPLLELPQRRPRVEAELLHQRPPVLLERPKRVGLPARPVEGEHEQGPDPLAQRVLARQGLDLGDEVSRPPAAQLGVEQLLVRSEPELTEPLRLRLRPLLVRKLRIGVPAPLAEGQPQHRGSSDRIAVGREPPRLTDHRLEPGYVEGVIGQLQSVARRLGHHADPVGTVDHAPDPGDIAAQGGARGRRRLAVEHDVGKPVGGHDGVAVDEEHCEEAPLPGPADRQLAVVVRDRDAA